MKSTEIKFKFKNNFRVFNSGDEITLNVPMYGILYMGGKNGSGKSTLLHMIRAIKDSLYKMNMSRWDGITPQKISDIKNDLDNVVDISGLDQYDDIFFLDSVIDNPMSAIGAGATAYSFVENGGYASQRISNGQTSTMLFLNYKKKISEYLKKYSDAELLKKRFLFIIDEADEGLDMYMQSNWNKILTRNFIFGYGGDVICVSHNPFCMLSKSHKASVYDLSDKKEKSVGDYITDMTKIKLNIEYDESESDL